MSQTAAVEKIEPAERVEALIAITERLSEIFSAENKLLSAHRAREIAPLQAEKARLAAAYAQSIRSIAQDRSMIEDANGTLLAELKDITRIFEKRAAEQRTLLDGARAAGEGVMKAVADELASATSAPGYNGPATADARQQASAPAAIALDENV